FFSMYPSFSYNPSNSAMEEFYRLCNTHHWRREAPEREAARRAFNKALVLQFNHNFGTDVEDLHSWQVLAGLIGMDPIPDKLGECRRRVKASHVNLVDLIDAFAAGEQASQFPSEMALSVYTKDTGKFFPRHDIHAGDLLKSLLRNILYPSQNRGNR
ncbi:hypothetical protein BDN70DRAFT_787389, partial [Pholiota conissans]